MNIKNFQTKFFGKNDTLNLYLSEVRKYDVPTVEEEEALIERMENGDMSARDELVLRNQRFLYSLAKIYAKSEDDVLEYVSEGNIGFMKGLADFNGNHGTRVLSFCVWYIRREMNHYLTNTSNMVVRSNNMKIGKKVDAVKDEYYKEFGVYPTDDEVMMLIEDKYGIKIKDVRDVYDVNVSSISDEIDDDFTVEENSEFTVKTSSYNLYEKEIEKGYYNAMIEQIFSSMDGMEKEKDIIKMLYGIGYDREYTVNEVGDKFGMYPEDIETLRNRTLKYLKQNSSRIAV